MKFWKRLFGKKEEPVLKSNSDFWDWFVQNEHFFYKAVKEQNDIEEVFLNPLASSLKQLQHKFFYLTGMIEDDQAELIITPDGDIPKIVFVEELMAAAPSLPNWKFTALKPSSDISRYGIKLNGLSFDKENLSFYPIENEAYPDEIDLTIVYNHWQADEERTIGMGILLFLDNYLGELAAITSIDNLDIIGKQDAQKKLIPIEKLKSYVKWRQKEFIEKYEGTRYDTEEDKHSIFEGRVGAEELPLIAVINTELLGWDGKASHPWIVTVKISYPADNESGMPNSDTLQQLDIIEELVLSQLKDYEGYLNIGRETANKKRIIFFACKDFRKPSKVIYHLQKDYAHSYPIEYDIYKDKYWRSFNRYHRQV